MAERDIARKRERGGENEREMEKRKRRESTRWEDGNQEREVRRGIGCDGERDESEEREKKLRERETGLTATQNGETRREK